MTTTKKAPAKAVKKTKTAKKTVKKPVKVASFRPVKETSPFLTFKLTEQSIYWLVLSTFVLILGLWVVNLHLEVQQIYDQIELSEAEYSYLDSLPVKK